VKRFAVLLPLLLLAAGCGDTWDRFTTPDFSWSRDRALSADRTPAALPERGTRVAPLPRETARQSGPSYRTAAESGCYRGRLTGEGNTCQAMRTDGGNLLTLAGPLRGFGTGDTVCVCGVAAAQQFCHQGLTLLIREISDSCANIQ